MLVVYFIIKIMYMIQPVAYVVSSVNSVSKVLPIVESDPFVMSDVTSL